MTSKHVLVICARRYNGHELWTLLGILQQKGCTFEVVSTELVIKDELTFRPNLIKRKVYEVLPSDIRSFDAVCVVSGNMKDTEAYWKDKHIQTLLLTARSEEKVLAAICCSVPTLGPVVQGIKVSFFPLVRSRHALEKAGAVLNPVSLTVDKKTITAENQMITQMWAEEIAHMLGSPDEPPLYEFTSSGFTPKGRERRMSKEVRAAIDSAKALKNL